MRQASRHGRWFGQRNRILSLVASCLGAVALLAGGATAAQAGTVCANTWTGNSSSAWGDTGNWSTGQIPGAASINTNNENVCLPTGARNYPVQLAPYTVFVPNVGNEGVQDTQLGDLSIASGAGLVVHGDSYDYLGDGYQQTNLTVAGSGTIALGGSLELLATDDGVQTPENTHGGSATLNGAGTITNAGSFTSVSTTTQATASDNTFHNRLDLGFVNAPGSTGAVSSGYLDIDGATITNQSQWTVAAGATENIIHNQLVAPQADFVNQGSYVDAGTTIVGGTGYNNETPDIFTESGPESGDPVDLRIGSELNDASGTGSFLMNDQNSQLAGTIPAGQTVTIEGDLYRSDTFTNTVTLQGTQVVNQGTLVLSTPNASTDTYPDTVVNGATLVNQGTIDTVDAAPALFNEIDASVQNQHGGAMNVQSGQLHLGGNGQTVTNDGTMTVAPAAQIYGNNSPFNGGPVMFTNASDGTLVPQIASATSFGTFRTDTNETFNVSGATAPQLVGGYTPALGTSFAVYPETSGSYSKIAGSFGAIGAGFSADYSKETDSPGGISLVWGGLPASPGGGGIGSGASKPTLRLGKPTVKGETVLVKLTCPAGDSCSEATVAAAVREILRHGRVIGIVGVNKRPRDGVKEKTVAVASAHVTVAAGGHKTVTLRLNRAATGLLARFGKLKLAVRVTAGTALKRTFSVTLHEPRKHHATRKRHKTR